MRKLIVGAMVSLDGVMQAPGAPVASPGDSTPSPSTQRAGEIEVGDTSSETPSERELARRERVKREQ